MSQSFYLLNKYLIWNFKYPFVEDEYTSPDFALLNLRLGFSLEISDQNLNPALRLCRRKLIVDERESLTLKICCIENGSYSDSALIFSYDSCALDEVFQAKLLTKDDIIDIFPVIANHGEFTIVCAFYGSDDETLPVMIKEDNETTSNNGQSFDLEIPQSTILNSQSNLESLSQDFSKLLNKGFLTDVRLSCEERIFPAHKNILAARSETFSAMFLNEVDGNKTDIIDIRDMDASVMEAFLKYLYSGKFDDELPEDIITKLYAAGDKYAVKSLKQICSKCMAENLNEKNFLDFVLLSDVHNDKELQSEVAYFVSRHKKLLLEDAWIYFSEIHPRLADKFFTDVHWMST